MTRDEEVTQDALLSGRVQLLQPRRGHRAGTDAVILAGLAEIRPGDHVIDLGSASGAVGLMVAARHAHAHVTMIDREPHLVELARQNITLNGFESCAAAVEADVFATGAGWTQALQAERGAADVIVTNPPFFETGEPRTRTSSDEGRRAARSMSGGDLKDWVSAARRCLAPQGRLWMIHRADRLEACLEALRPHFGSLRVTPIYPRPAEPASRVLIASVLGGGGPTCLAAPLVLHQQDGAFTPPASRLHSGRDGP